MHCLTGKLYYLVLALYYLFTGYIANCSEIAQETRLSCIIRVDLLCCISKRRQDQVSREALLKLLRVNSNTPRSSSKFQLLNNYRECLAAGFRAARVSPARVFTCHWHRVPGGCRLTRAHRSLDSALRNSKRKFTARS